MPDKTIEEVVKEIIIDKLKLNETQVREITPKTTFLEDLGADSLDQVEIVMALEDKFKIKIPEEEAEKIRTVGDAMKYIEEHYQREEYSK